LRRAASDFHELVAGDPVRKPKDVAALTAAIRAVYQPWLEELAERLQSFSTHYPVSGPAQAPRHDPEDGAVTISKWGRCARPDPQASHSLPQVPWFWGNEHPVVLAPGTGKSHLYQQVSPYAHLVSGGKASVARMFVNNATGQRGLVCQYDVVCFDEVSGISFDQKDGVNIMKGYMESGEFSRGKESIRGFGGIIMVGNFDVDVSHQQRIGAGVDDFPGRHGREAWGWRTVGFQIAIERLPGALRVSGPVRRRSAPPDRNRRSSGPGPKAGRRPGHGRESLRGRCR
jgi:hypothetical protein